jgi:hypothetical protein
LLFAPQTDLMSRLLVPATIIREFICDASYRAALSFYIITIVVS